MFKRAKQLRLSHLKPEITIVLVWIAFAITYVAVKLLLNEQMITGIVAFIGEVGGDLACFILALIATFKSKEAGQRRILRLFAISFFFSILSDGLYNLTVNILGINALQISAQILFGVPFLLFLIFQLIAWGYLFAGIRQKRLVSSLPFLLAIIIVIMSFVWVNDWQISYFSLPGLFNIAKTVLEALTFGLVLTILCAAKDRRLILLCFGYCLIVTTSFMMRVAEVDKQLLAGSLLEMFWVLGLGLMAIALWRILLAKDKQSTFTLYFWNSLKTQISYWAFIYFLLVVVLLIIIHWNFASCSFGAYQNLPAILIVLALISATITQVVSPYLIRPFVQLSQLVQYYCKDRKAVTFALEPTGILELDQLQQTLKKGLNTINLQQVDNDVRHNAALEYANTIRSPVNALQMVVEDDRQINSDNKALILEACQVMIDKTNRFLSIVSTEKKPLDVRQTPPQSYVMVDDDQNLACAWELEAISLGLELLCFHDAKSFQQAISTIPKAAAIYFDFNLNDGSGMNGAELAKWASEQGFANLYLISGIPVDNPAAYPWVKACYGKNPPFVSKI